MHHLWRRLFLFNCCFHVTTPLSNHRKAKAFPQQTPHSGRHFYPTHPAYSSQGVLFSRLFRRRRRFTEGWYYRLTLPNDNTSFAFILSIEDPGLTTTSTLGLVCIQVVGPNDGYLVQASRDDTLLWASRHEQSLGCTFAYKQQQNSIHSTTTRTSTVLDPATWKETVESGFQILPTSFLGRVHGRDGTTLGRTVMDYKNDNDECWTCEFDFTVEPLVGWGGAREHEQKSTAGWLSHWPIFEPHWQITLADAKASGTVRWRNDTTFTFENAPFYAEKNWGAALPQKWFWTQCNAFDGYNMSIVAGGGIRKIPFGKQEALGMVSLHWEGQFYEAVPWMGGMSWSVDPWGRWALRGNSTVGDRPFAIEVTYECDKDVGLLFRAPTPDEGLVRFCKDTFEANCTLNLWALERNQKGEWGKVLPPLIDRATSRQGGAEVGGGPWWDTWESEAKVKKPIQRLLRVPYYWGRFKTRLGKALRRKMRVVE